jgi:hypothetical protein
MNMSRNAWEDEMSAKGGEEGVKVPKADVQRIKWLDL